VNAGDGSFMEESHRHREFPQDVIEEASGEVSIGREHEISPLPAFSFVNVDCTLKHLCSV
jgi:hypothetical protein